MGKKDAAKSGGETVVTTTQKGGQAAKAGVQTGAHVVKKGAEAGAGAVKSGGQYAVETAKKPLKKKKKGSDSSSEEEPRCNEVAPDCFQMVNPIYLVLMFLIITLLGMCALIPDDCELIPGIGGFMREHAGWVGLLFYGIVVLNAVLSAVAVKHCLDFHLTTKTTIKWFSQTLLAGYPSLKMLKEMEIEYGSPEPTPQASVTATKDEKKKK